MSGSSFVRKHVRALLGLLNLLIVATSLQLIGVRADRIGPVRPVPDAGVSVEASRIEALRVAPNASPPPAAYERSGKTVAATPHVSPASLPIAGKGMWIWLFDQVEGGNASRIVSRAKSLGLSHIYVRSSSTTSGLKFLPHIDRILPIAHANRIRVIAWDFPRLIDTNADIRRLVRVLDHRAPGGHKVDGIAVDLETPAEGVALTRSKARHLARRLAQVRPTRFRLLVPPRPSAWTLTFYPYEIIRYFNAVAPMVYWINRPAVKLVQQTMAHLRKYGRPIAPIGQAYDAAAEGGRAGPPPGRVLEAFAEQARRSGAVGVSFWSWQHANRDQLLSIRKIHFPVPGVRVPSRGRVDE